MKGFSGAVRVQRLTVKGLLGQEKHGKRLDESSQGRKISDEQPVTTTGLDLTELLAVHEAGAKRQGGAKYCAMHMLVQFPKELVDGDDAQLMLDHARAFAESVFGKEAVFADRVDRDEGSRHVVDLLIAPKYTKKTKAGETTWISLSRDLKALAKERGELSKTGEPNLRAQGRALQSEFHEYLVKRMGLEEAERGSAKLYTKADWKTPEEMKAAALAEQLGKQAIQDIRAIIDEATNLFRPHPERTGDVSLVDEGRGFELTPIVSPMAFFEIGKVAYAAKTHEAEIQRLKSEAAEDRHAASDLASKAEDYRRAAALALEIAKRDRDDAKAAREKAEREGQTFGYAAGFKEGKAEGEADLKEKREAAEREKKQAETLRKEAEEDRQKAAEDLLKATKDAEYAASDREAAKKDREAAKIAGIDAEALKSSWEAKNAVGVAEIERQKAEIAAERDAFAVEQKTAEANLETMSGHLAAQRREYTMESAELRVAQKKLKDDEEALDRDRDQLRSDREDLAKREAAFTAGVIAFASGKIQDAHIEGGVKTMVFYETVPPDEEKTIGQKIQPAFDAVWFVVNKAMTKVAAITEKVIASAVLREKQAAERLDALDEATRARVSPAVIQQIEAAPGATISPEEFNAAKQALAQTTGIGR